MFLHGGWTLAATSFWIFGDNLEDQFGHVGFVIFYVVCGIGAGRTGRCRSQFTNPNGGRIRAIAGIMGGYLLLFPKAKVDILLIFIIFFRVFPIPAWVMLGLWFGFQLVAGIADQAAAVALPIGRMLAGLSWVLSCVSRFGPTGVWRRSWRPPHPETHYAFQRPTYPK